MKSGWCVVIVVILVGCQKTRPIYHPEYIGTWKSYDTMSSWFTANYDGIILVIGADGSGYDNFKCAASGECRITKNFIEIDGFKIGAKDNCRHTHKIIEPPHEVAPFKFDPYDTDSFTIKMRLGVDRGAALIGYRETDFYKIE